MYFQIGVKTILYTFVLFEILRWCVRATSHGEHLSRLEGGFVLPEARNTIFFPLFPETREKPTIGAALFRPSVPPLFPTHAFGLSRKCHSIPADLHHTDRPSLFHHP